MQQMHVDNVGSVQCKLSRLTLVMLQHYKMKNLRTCNHQQDQCI